eukprot:Sspe_Gene.2556::Locus_860_Transcript_1_1_Confidence_1.000_Length_1322::g.2556::m.2556
MGTDQGTCTGAGCEWVGQTCRRKRCEHTTEAACMADAVCRWEGGACAATPCFVKHSDEAACNADSECHWDTAACGVCNQKYCPRTHGTDAGACNLDGKCRFDQANNKCVEKVCSDYDDPAKYSPHGACPCKADPLCVWDKAAKGGAGACKDKHFTTCPDLDVVVAFDGSCSMSKSFGRHPNG